MEPSLIFESLCSRTKLERDNAFQEFAKLVAQSNVDDEQLKAFEVKFTRTLNEDSSTWETKQSCLNALKVIVDGEKNSNSFCCDSLKDRSLVLLADEEFRVRIAAGEVLGSLCQRFGPEIYGKCREAVFALIVSDLERNRANEASKSNVAESHQVEDAAARIVQESAGGWLHLETNVKALSFMLVGCGFQLAPYVDGRLIELTIKVLSHPNRFVREIGFSICSSLINFTCRNNGSENAEMMIPIDDVEHPLFTYCDEFVSLIASGMSDTWGEVRLPACVAARHFLLNIRNPEFVEKYFPLLLPPLCLNRYHLAEGVRVYAQHTWVLTVGTKGPKLVEKYIDNIVNYYIEQSTCSNYTVRLSACQCIAELLQKINAETVKPYVSVLHETLSQRFKDVSWQVRDAACLACEKLFTQFPQESLAFADTSFTLFFDNLYDSVETVSNGASESLSKVIEIYGAETFAKVFPLIKEGLKKIDDQPASVATELSKQSFLNDRNAAKMLGSLAGNVLQLDHGTTGFVVHSTQKTPQPWQVVEGCVRLVAELSSTKIPSAQPKIASSLLPLIVSAVQKRNYVEHVQLLETVCLKLPRIAHSMEKRYMKPMLDDFIEPIFYGLICECAITEAAATKCIEELANIFGINIMRAKIERINSKFSPMYEEVLKKAASNVVPT